MSLSVWLYKATFFSKFFVNLDVPNGRVFHILIIYVPYFQVVLLFNPFSSWPGNIKSVE